MDAFVITNIIIEYKKKEKKDTALDFTAQN